MEARRKILEDVAERTHSHRRLWVRAGYIGQKTETSICDLFCLAIGRGANREDEARGGPRVDEAEERMPE